MENKNGNGIFLGIVSVATLIVAIIGATFAYFSASTESNTDAVNLTAYEFKLSLSVNPIYPNGASALIPLEPTTVIPNAPEPNNTNLLYALNVAKNRCIDDQGLQVCALYQVIIENQAVNPITLTGQLKTVSNNKAEGEGKTPFTNLTYQAVAGDHTTGLSLVGGPVTIDDELGGLIDISGIKVSGATTDEDGELVPGKGYSYILIYLDDNLDQSSEMGASFTGQLIYSSGTGAGNNLTGTFTVAAPSEEGSE